MEPDPEALIIPDAGISTEVVTPLEAEAAPAAEIAPVPETSPEAVFAAEPEPALAEDSFEYVAEEPTEAELSQMAEGLESLSNAIAVEHFAEEVKGEEDAAADWWGTEQMEMDEATAAVLEPSEAQLLNVLKAIKRSNQPAILEIAGLPAVCLIPARNIYFTSAPAARIESAMAAQTEVTWRTCASEAEARQLSGTVP